MIAPARTSSRIVFMGRPLLDLKASSSHGEPPDEPFLGTQGLARLVEAPVVVSMICLERLEFRSAVPAVEGQVALRIIRIAQQLGAAITGAPAEEPRPVPLEIGRASRRARAYTKVDAHD